MSFFSWEATWKNVLTLDRTQMRELSLANRCYLCLLEEETIDHILLHCVLARSLWNLLVSLFGVSWVLPYSVKEALLGWFGPCVGKERKKVWFLAPLCLFWIAWKERNNRVFENEGHLVQGCKSFFLCNLWAWTKRFLFLSLVYYLYTLGHVLDVPFSFNILLFILKKSIQKISILYIQGIYVYVCDSFFLIWV